MKNDGAIVLIKVLLTILQLLIGSVFSANLGQRPTLNYRSDKKKFKIVSKMDFFRVISGGLFWEITLLILIFLQLYYWGNKAIKYWRALPLHNP